MTLSEMFKVDYRMVFEILKISKKFKIDTFEESEDLLYSFSRAHTTNSHKLGGLNNGNVFSHSFGS